MKQYSLSPTTFASEVDLRAFLQRSVPPIHELPEHFDDIVAQVHFVLPKSDDEWFIAAQSIVARNHVTTIGLWKGSAEQFGSKIYEVGSIDTWQLTSFYEHGRAFLDTTWIPQTLASIVGNLRSRGYVPRHEATRYF